MSNAAMEYLDQHDLLVLCTASAAGVPHAAAMFYATDGTKIYFSAPDTSTTAKNLKANPQAAVTVADAPADWASAKGLQIQGSVAELDDEADKDEETRAAGLFAARYPHLGDAVHHTHYWRLDPSAIQFTDNARAGDQSAESLGQTWTSQTITF